MSLLVSHFLRSLFSFFVRPEGRFSVPTRVRAMMPRADAVKDGRRPPPQAARSVLDGVEHGVTLHLVGTATIDRPGARQRGVTPVDLRAACGQEATIASQPCIR
jgi:hypothetical protein